MGLPLFPLASDQAWGGGGGDVGEESYVVTHFLANLLTFFFFFFGLFRAALVAYGSSQARGLIGAVATGLSQSHSNTRSELHL